MASEQDLAKIWQWNATVPEQIDKSVNDLISAKIRERPDSPAVCAWDGDFTYDELDRYATAIAIRLIDSGIRQDEPVIACLGKTKWTAVAFLGIIRAGGVILAVDTSQPVDRLHQIVRKAEARAALALTTFKSLAQSIVEEVIVVDEVSPDATSDRANSTQILPKVSSVSPLYIVFTSGSTGAPKGVVVTHSNFSSAVHHQADALHFSSQSRVYDFASSSFDVALNNVLMTLCVGGCICVPSEEDRKNNLASSLTDLKANQVYITPTVARLIDPETVRGLEVLSLGGESLTGTDIAQWSSHVKLVGSYGPAECTCCCSTIENLTSDHISNIGSGCGVNIWLVDPQDSSKLVAIGDVGEILLEGPLVGKGYLNDESQTTAAFVENPQWLQAGHGTIDGRSGRLYKTGDLARFQANGELLFAGRKDTMVKISGQRVELSEVEYRVQQHLPDYSIIVEVINPRDSKRPILLAFLAKEKANAVKTAKGSKHRTSISESEFPATFDIHDAISNIGDKLKQTLPSYMLPYAYIPIEEIPTLISGKINRKQIRALGSQLSLKQIEYYSEEGAVEFQAPSTQNETRLRGVWVQALQMEIDSIGADDNFFRIGGDSVIAMRLILCARKEGIRLSVRDVFQYPRLRDMAEVICDADKVSAVQQVEKFGLLEPAELHDTLNSVKQLINHDGSQINDVLPVTSYQAMSLDDRQAPFSIDHFHFEFDQQVDVERLKQACGTIFQAYDVLRAVFVRHNESYLQVILKDLTPIIDDIQTSELEECTATTCREIRKSVGGLGHLFTRFSIIRSESEQKQCLILTVSHAQYDGLSLPVFLEDLQAFYSEDTSPSSSSFAGYMHGVTQAQRESRRFWLRVLKGPLMTALPTPQSKNNSSGPKKIHIIRSVPMIHPSEGFTTATIIYAAWALLLSHITNSNDIVFGRLVSGRNVPSIEAERTFGACANRIPMRISLTTAPSDSDSDTDSGSRTESSSTTTDTNEDKDNTLNLAALLSSIQRHQADSTLHETTGLSELTSPTAPVFPLGTKFETVVQYQNIDLSPSITLAGTTSHLVHVHQDLMPIETQLRATPRDGKTLEFEILSNTSIIDEEVAQKAMDGFVKFFEIVSEEGSGSRRVDEVLQGSKV